MSERCSFFHKHHKWRPAQIIDRKGRHSLFWWLGELDLRAGEKINCYACKRCRKTWSLEYDGQ